jgi:hypothetical protein
MLYGVTLGRQLTADVILVMAAINGALVWVIASIIPGARGEPKPLDRAKLPKAIAFIVGTPLVFYLFLRWHPEGMQHGCRGNGRCLAYEEMIGSRHDAFALVWLTSMMLQWPFIAIYALLERALTHWVRQFWRRE